MHTPCAVIPETAKRLSGVQKAKQNKEVLVPVFAFSETGMTTNYFRARGGRGRFSLRSPKRVQQGGCVRHHSGITGQEGLPLKPHLIQEEPGTFESGKPILSLTSLFSQLCEFLQSRMYLELICCAIPTRGGV